MTDAPTTRSLSLLDRARILWAAARYDFWLEYNSVSRKQRRALRRELRSNLTEASNDAGSSTALNNVGPLRALAAETTKDGQLRSRWVAGSVAALTTFATLFVVFLFLSVYYIEGVLDAGTTEPVSSSLFPFFGSDVSFDPSDRGISWQVSPGPMPFAAALAAWLVKARPWRAIRRRGPAPGIFGGVART